VAILLLSGPSATPLRAADPEGFAMWKSVEMLAETRMLNKMRRPGEELAAWGNHRATLMQLDQGPTPFQAHDYSDVLFILNGEGVLTIGSELVDAKTSEPGERRGSAIKDAETKKISPGDVIHIPAKAAHQVAPNPGSKLAYVALRIDATGASAK
jgi:mannose-6-phosphate isomerase-like protein (cupin superfamily)